MSENFGRKDMDEKVEYERRLQTVIKELTERHPAYSIQQARTDYRVNYNTLRNRFMGVSQPKALAHQHLQRLSPAEERMLIRHIKEQDDYGYPPTRASILEMATNLLSPGSEPLGVNWHEGFEARNPDVKIILCSALDRQRALTNSRSGYETYWANLVYICVTYGIPPENMWNFDEKGFIIGKCGRYTVYTRPDRHNPGKLIQSGNRQSTTDGETISAAGKFIPPYIINRGKIHTVDKF